MFEGIIDVGATEIAELIGGLSMIDAVGDKLFDRNMRDLVPIPKILVLGSPWSLSSVVSVLLEGTPTKNYRVR